MDVSSLLISLAVSLGLMIVGWLVIAHIRKSLLASDRREFGDDLTMEDAHRMHARGQISDKEHKRLKEQVSRRSREFLDEVARSDEESNGSA